MLLGGLSECHLGWKGWSSWLEGLVILVGRVGHLGWKGWSSWLEGLVILVGRVGHLGWKGWSSWLEGLVILVGRVGHLGWKGWSSWLEGLVILVGRVGHLGWKGWSSWLEGLVEKNRIRSLKLTKTHLKIGRNSPKRQTKKYSNHQFSGANLLLGSGSSISFFSQSMFILHAVLQMSPKVKHHPSWWFQPI